jgi:hypothetical protein
MHREPHPPTLGNEPLEEGDEQSASPVTRFGTVVGGGVIAAIVASLPAELRIGDGGSVFRALEQWLALAALLTPLAILVVAVFRRSRTGLRILAGEHAELFAAAALWWAIIELGLLAVGGAVLRAKTHHHGLAGVTFSILELVSGLVIALLAVRGVRMLSKMPAGGHRVALALVSGCAFLAIVLVGFRTARAEGLHTAAALVDALALAVAGAIASTRVVSRLRMLAMIGVPVAAAILLLGIATVRAEPDLGGILAEGAPLHAWVLGLFR